jgi:hypothetical protein
MRLASEYPRARGVARLTAAGGVPGARCPARDDGPRGRLARPDPAGPPGRPTGCDATRDLLLGREGEGQ